MEIERNGLSINFEYIPHKCSPHRYPRTLEEASAINNEVKKLLLKGVIIPTSIEKQNFFSNIFVRPKTDGTYRMILNLKALNFSVNAAHFKMESIHNVIQMVQHNSWMTSVDLKDAFYSTPVKMEHQKFLKFPWDLPYQYTAMSNGYADATRIFTNILKPPFSLLRKLGHQSVVYVDDTFRIGSTVIECAQNIDTTIFLLQL